MAQEIVGVKIQVDGSQASEQVGSLKKQLKEATQDVQRLSDQFGATSKEAIQAAKRAADLRDRIGDAKALTDAFNPEAKFKALGQTLSAVTGGFAAVQGAIGLFGAESKDLEKQLLKVQSAIALTQGVEQLAGLGDAFKNLKAVAIDAFKGIKAAIGSTGIGLLVIALGAIYAYWDDIKEAVSGVSEEQEKLNKATKENLETQKKKLDAIGDQDNILKLQGKSERDILKIKIAQTDETIKAAEANVANLKSQRNVQIEISKRNKDILEGIIRFVQAPIVAILKGVDLIAAGVGKSLDLEKKFTGGLAKLVFDPEQTAKDADNAIAEAEKGLTSLKNQRAGYQLAIQNIDKQAADKRKQDADKARQEQIKENEKELERRKQDTAFEEEQIKRRLKTFGSIANAQITQDQKVLDRLTEFSKAKEDLINRNISIDTKAGEIAIENIKKVGEANKKQFDEDLKLEKARTDAKLAAYQDIGKGLSALGQIVGQQTAAGKALASAEALINTFVGITQIWKNDTLLPEPLGTIQKVAATITAAASGFAAVKNINKVQIPGGGGGSSVPTMGSINAPLGMVAPQAQLTQLNQQSINQLGSATSRAYVVESDVTSSQERQARINRAARIG